ncbi:MAG: type antifreeze protein [Acidobacteriaceae bacterium]|nr:type antifreeze protein [Acidobacteriaceae bacterium]
MPLYEYQCKKCKHRFEKIQLFSAKPIKKCPECGGPVEKLLSAPAIQFKGTGWYVNDYAKKSAGSQSSSEPGDGAAKSSSGEKSEAKSGTETASKSDGSGSSKDSGAKSESKESKPTANSSSSSSSSKGSRTRKK